MTSKGNSYTSKENINKDKNEPKKSDSIRDKIIKKKRCNGK